MTYGPEPKIDLNSWEIRIFGLVEQEITLNWDQFSNLQWTSTVTDFHCVTQWSQLDNIWDGVKFADFVEAARPKPEAKFVMAHGYGGNTAHLPLNLSMEEGILDHTQDGEPMGMSHGWPLRLIIPSVYGWKSAKWVNGIELMAKDSPGFWEQRGYHNEGNPWKEERFWPELTK